METTYEQLYNQIVKCYPLGIKDTDEAYFIHPGFKQLVERRRRMIETEAGTWQAFVESFQAECDEVLEIFQGPPLDEPCFAAELLLFKEEFRGGTYSRSIVFRLSFIGPFFTIYGVDRVRLMAGKNLALECDPIYFVSPVGFYEIWFNLIRDRMEREYKAIFVPYELSRRHVGKLYVPGGSYKQHEDATIYQALFSSYDITKAKRVDSKFYNL